MPHAAAPAQVAAVMLFLRENARWLAAGFLLALGSSFGQTFFISFFAEPIRGTFDLSHGEWSRIYMIGTLASALALVQLGQRADSTPPRLLAAAILVVFAAVCVGMATVSSVWALPLLVFGLRLCGQGMLSHLSQTLTARWFVATRGRALAIVSFGYPVGEAFAPLAAVALIAAIGWRETWGVAALCLVVFFLPTLWLLLSRDRQPKNPHLDPSSGTVGGETSVGARLDGTGRIEKAQTETRHIETVQIETGLGGRHWTRVETIRSRPFWLIAAGLVSPSASLTVTFFFPNLIADLKGWPLEAWAASYSIYAISAVVFSFVAGWAIDRFGAVSILPAYQLPMALGLIALSILDAPWAMTLIMGLMGVTAGAASATHSALLAELFGLRHLGAIKALAHALMVFGTAAGPGLVGQFLDWGVSFETLCLWMAGYAVAVSLLYLLAQSALRD